MDRLKVKQEVLSKLNKLNQSWIEKGDIKKLEKYFHNGIIVFEPGRKELRKGKVECIEG